MTRVEAEKLLRDVVRRLCESERGANAVKIYREVRGELLGLDACNQIGLLVLIQVGFEWPGTTLELLNDECGPLEIT